MVSLKDELLMVAEQVTFQSAVTELMVVEMLLSVEVVLVLVLVVEPSVAEILSSVRPVPV